MKHFKWIFACLACVTCVSISALRGDPIATAPATRPATRPEDLEAITTKLTIRPSAIGRPALKYKLLPDVVDQTPGNAVTLYLLSREFWPNEQKTPELLYPEKRRFDYQETPIDQFPRKYSEALLAGYAKTLKYVDLGARRREAVWDTGLRDGTLVKDTEALVRYLNDLRHVANLLGFRASFAVSQGDWVAASHSLQTSFSLARHAASEPMLIHALVASGFAQIAINHGVEEWIAHGESPNLYWALAELPDPFVELRSVAQSIPLELRYWKPQLARALRGELPAEQWPEVLREMVGTLQESQPPLQKRDAAEIEVQVKKLIDSAYLRARKYLIASGMGEEAVRAMSGDQAVGTYLCQEYNGAAEELWKAWALPFWQAEKQILSSWKNLAPDQAPLLENPLFQADFVRFGDRGPRWSAPQLLGTRWQLARADRCINLMRTIEAIRDYAARHDGKLPERLEQITELPLPIDPITGTPFGYRLIGQTAILDAPAPAWLQFRSGQRYELTIGK